jgi:hypothetical protein
MLDVECQVLDANIFTQRNFICGFVILMRNQMSSQGKYDRRDLIQFLLYHSEIASLRSQRHLIIYCNPPTASKLLTETEHRD